MLSEKKEEDSLFLVEPEEKVSFSYADWSR